MTDNPSPSTQSTPDPAQDDPFFDKKPLALKYWELANTITAFAIVQMIALVLAAATTDSLRVAIACNKPITEFGILAGTCIYGLAIWHCYTIEIKLVPSHDMFFKTMVGRVILASLAGIAGILWVVFLQ